MKNCTYCQAFDHTIEHCSQLIEKWQARIVINPNPVHNPNGNTNLNIQMILIEIRQPQIAVVTRGGDEMGAYQNTQQGQPQVKPMEKKKAPLDFWKEKEVFLDAPQEFVDINQLSTSGQVRAMPKIFEQLIGRAPMKKVSKLKDFFKTSLALIHDKYDVTKLATSQKKPQKTCNLRKELVISE